MQEKVLGHFFLAQAFFRLGKVLAGLWHPSSRSLLRSRYAENLLRDSLEGALYLERDCLEGEFYLEDRSSSHEMCIVYLYIFGDNCHKRRLLKRQSELLELMIVENIVKTEEVERGIVVDVYDVQKLQGT